MASFLPHVKTHFPSSSSPQFPIPNSKFFAPHNLQTPGGYGNVDSIRLRQPFDNGKRCILWKLKCAKGGSVGEIERKLEEQIDTEEDLARIGRLTGRCKEVGGMVELLECLEREAIMGEDEGKEPMDYNRRAQIFDKSSRVFQALKERSETTNGNSGL